jgi:cell division protein FtsW
MLAGRGLYLALKCEDDFGALLSVGLTAIVFLQAFIIMAGDTRLVPLTGITLPFISYGGSSLVSNLLLLGLLLCVSGSPREAVWRRRRGRMRGGERGAEPGAAPAGAEAKRRG